MKTKTNGKRKVHPYLRIENWNGTLAFWRGSGLYSQETKDKYEKWLSEELENSKKVKLNLINPNIK